jgi:hypothetical protein
VRHFSWRWIDRSIDRSVDRIDRSGVALLADDRTLHCSKLRIGLRFDPTPHASSDWSRAPLALQAIIG